MSTKHGKLSIMKITYAFLIQTLLLITLTSCADPNKRDASNATTKPTDLPTKIITMQTEGANDQLPITPTKNTASETPSSSTNLSKENTILTTAHTAYTNNNWSSAISLYLEYLEASQENSQSHIDAHLGLAKSYIKNKQFSNAIDTLELFIVNHQQSNKLSDAIFLLGIANYELSNYKQSISYFSDYYDNYPETIDSYVLELIGDGYRALGNYKTASEYYQSAINKDRSSNINFLLLDKAEVLKASGQISEALSLFDLVAANTQYDNTRAHMDYERAQIMVSENDINKAITYYTHAVNNYPESYYAYLSLLELLNYGIIVDDLQRGLVDYYAKQYTPAILAFKRHISNNPEHDAKGHYYAALSYRELENINASKIHFQEIINNHTSDPLWGEAWLEIAYTKWGWEDNYTGAVSQLVNMESSFPNSQFTPSILSYAARIAERNNDLVLAGNLWKKVAQKYTSSTEAIEASFLAGITYYRNTNYDDALEMFQQTIELSKPGNPEYSGGLLWLGKTHYINNNATEAQEAWNKTIEADPTGYYGIRAKQLKNQRIPFQPVPDVNFLLASNNKAQNEAKDWIANNLNIEKDNINQMSPKLISDGRWIRGKTLWNLGLFDESKSELDSLLDTYKTDGLSSYQLALAYKELGYYYGTIWAGRYCMDSFDISNPLQAPKFITQLRYGPYYLDLISPISNKYNIDPLIVSALIRQESLYQGQVTSAAYAQGLMQIIPSTGDYIARQLKWSNYTTQDLYRPFINVPFGIFYLDEQLNIFNGDSYAALSAYNAGPGNTSIWKKLSQNDYDLFVEIIRLEEPQSYIKRIVEHYAVYHHLYSN